MTVFAWLCMAQNDDYNYNHSGTAPYLNLGVENTDMSTFLTQYLCLIRRDKQLSELKIPLTDLPEESPRFIDYDTYPEYLVDEMKVFKTLIIKKIEVATEEIVAVGDYEKKTLTFICNLDGLDILLHGIIQGNEFGMTLFSVSINIAYKTNEDRDSIEKKIVFWVVNNKMPVFYA